MKNLLILLSVVGMALAGCAGSSGSRQSAGTFWGAETGALAGSPVYQTVVQPVYVGPYPRYSWWPLTTIHFSYRHHSGHRYGGYYGRSYGRHDDDSRHRYRSSGFRGKYGGGHVYRGYGSTYGSGHYSKGYRGSGYGGHSQVFRRGGMGVGGGCRGRC